MSKLLKNICKYILDKFGSIRDQNGSSRDQILIKTDLND